MAGLLRDKRGQHGGDAIENTLDVDIDHFVPIVGLKRREGRTGHDPGIEEDHVDPAIGFGSQLYDRVVLGLFGDIERLPDRLAACGADLLGQSLKLILAPRPKHDLRTFRGQQSGSGRAG